MPVTRRRRARGRVRRRSKKTMHLTSNHTMGAINSRFKAYEKFISMTYLSEIARNILFVLVDATIKPDLFGGKVTKRLTGTNATGSIRRYLTLSRVYGAAKTAANLTTTRSGRIISATRRERSLCATRHREVGCDARASRSRYGTSLSSGRTHDRQRRRRLAASHVRLA